MSKQSPNGYAGDLSVVQAYSMLESDKFAILVDVRTKDTIFVEWQEYPSMQVAAEFAPRLLETLRARGVSATAPVLFLCRSGARSRAAALALTEAGQERCFNIAEGFEGPLDDNRRRGAVDGWKARGLPWAQS
jgi:rhodanese-related sulfurtransferase